MFRRAFCALALLLGSSAQAQTFIVNSAGDSNDLVDGLLTLRGAIAQANAVVGHDTILLPADIKINTALGYSITDDVTIAGVQGKEARLTSSASVLFNINSDEISVQLENLSLKGTRDNAGVLACGEVMASNVAATDFFEAFKLCQYPVGLTIELSRFHNNRFFLEADLNKGHEASVLINRSVMENSGAFIRSKDADLNVKMLRSRYIAENAEMLVLGSASLQIVDSALWQAKKRTLLRGIPDGYTSPGATMPNYYFPTLKIVQSTITGNKTNHPVIWTEGTTLEISHSTIADNANNNGPLILLDGYSDSYTGVTHGSAEIDHTIIDRFHSTEAPILLNKVDLQARYSFIPVINKKTGSESVSLDSTTALYQGSSAHLGGLITSFSHLPYYLPEIGSPVVDAGDPLVVAGVNGVPVEEQRSSKRVLGTAIDIGSTELNHEPVLDEEGLRADYQDKVDKLEDPDADIWLDLDDYVTDPDGHAILGIVFHSQSELTYTPGPNIVEGHQLAFKAGVMGIVILEETGLSAIKELDWRPKTTSAKAANSSGGGGSLPLTILGAIALLGMGRSRRRRVLAKP